MPIYPIVCTKCGKRDEVLAPASQCESLKCPECGAKAEQDYAAKNVTLGDGARSFTGSKQVSRQWAFHPREVEKAQKLAGKFGGADMANAIQKNGDCHFKNRAQSRKFTKTMEQVGAALKAGKARADARARSRGTSGGGAQNHSA